MHRLTTNSIIWIYSLSYGILVTIGTILFSTLWKWIKMAIRGHTQLRIRRVQLIYREILVQQTRVNFVIACLTLGKLLTKLTKRVGRIDCSLTEGSGKENVNGVGNRPTSEV